MNFIFDPRRMPNGFRGEIVSGIRSKAALLNAIAASLLFPDYFGENWDALDECIRDLSWLPAGDVVLVHNEVPLRDDLVSLSTYVSILNSAVESWRAKGERNLLVVFPLKARAAVQTALNRAETRISSSSSPMTPQKG